MSAESTTASTKKERATDISVLPKSSDSSLLRGDNLPELDTQRREAEVALGRTKKNSSGGSCDSSTWTAEQQSQLGEYVNRNYARKIYTFICRNCTRTLSKFTGP